MNEKDIIDDVLNFRISDSLFINFHTENLSSHYSGVMGGAFRCAKTATLVKRINYIMINKEGDCGWVIVRSWVALALLAYRRKEYPKPRFAPLSPVPACLLLGASHHIFLLPLKNGISEYQNATSKQWHDKCRVGVAGAVPDQAVERSRQSRGQGKSVWRHPSSDLQSVC